MSDADREITLHQRIYTLTEDLAQARRWLGDAGRERDALRAEVARLRPLRALFDHAVTNHNYVSVEWYPSRAPDGATVQIDGWTAGGGTLDAVITAACDRLGVDHG